MKNRFFQKLIILILFTTNAYATVSMHLDHDKINLNETLTLTITTDNPKNQSAPNINILEKDFSILSAEHRMNYQFNNGISNTNNEWVYLLFPKHTGIIHLPQISIGQEKTTSTLTIEVNTASTKTPTQQDKIKDIQPLGDVFIKSHVNTHSSYINAEIIYTVKVFSRRHLLDIDYTPPIIPNALVIPINDGQQTQTLVGNDVYSVQVLKYAVFPNISGTITIKPPVLSALMVDFIPERVQVTGQTATINVKSAPQGIEPFLPAHKIELSESFAPQAAHLKEGQTLTRIITIKGIGVPSSLLPIPTLTSKNLEVYPNPPTLQDLQSAQGITGASTIKVTYLFEKNGTYSLPAINIPWFNIKTQTLENAALPSHTFTITQENSKFDAASKIKQTPNINTHTKTTPQISWWMISTLILSLIVLYLLIRPWLIFKKLIQKLKPTNKNPSLAKIKRELYKACQEQNPHKAAQGILSWANLNWSNLNKPYLNLKQISEHCKNTNLAIEIDTLIQHLYGQNPQDIWHGVKFWQAFAAFIKKKHDKSHTKKHENHLPPLNPDMAN